jgi:Xaa-Pro aminopeptidase
MATHITLPADRVARYHELLAEEGAGGLVLTSEPAVQHASGVHLYTQRLIPQRPVALVLTPGRAPRMVCCVLELDQVAAERPELEIDAFPEFGVDPWESVARILSARPDGDVLVEDTMPVAWCEQLRGHLGDRRVRVSADVSTRARAIKDGAEHQRFREASDAADRALAAGAAAVAPGVSEHEVAERIVATFQRLLPGRTSEVSAMSIAQRNNRAMHHLPTADTFTDSGPVRLGIVGRVDGYWIIITRMLILGDDAGLLDAYRRYVEVYEASMAELRPGASCAELYERCRVRAAAAGFELTTLKTGHGTGLDFRERPWISPAEDAVLEPGMILAFDYGLDTEDGHVLHIEDRVAVTDGAPERLSGGWDLRDPRTGFAGLLRPA